MPRHLISDLNECSEFRQTIASRPPKIIHGTALLLAFVLLSTLGWTAYTRANLVVVAPGRIRPNEIPTRVFTSGSADFVGRVVEARFDEGDLVKQGDVLVRLDTSQIDNLIAKLTRTIKGNEQELKSLAGQRNLLSLQAESATKKSSMELQLRKEAYRRVQLQRESDVRNAAAELRLADDTYRRLNALRQNNVVTQQELIDAETKLDLAREKLVRAELPVDGAAIDVALQALELVDRDFAVRNAELDARIIVKQEEGDALRKDLANLELQRLDAVLVSPIDGIIVAGRVRVGDVLESATPVFELARQQSSCFEAAVSGDDVGHLRVGLPARIRFDAYDFQRYGALEGTVSFISPDSRTQKLPELVEQLDRASDSHVTFIVRIQLHADEVTRGDYRGQVKLGLGGKAEIITGNESLLKILLRRIHQTISLV